MSNVIYIPVSFTYFGSIKNYIDLEDYVDYDNEDDFLEALVEDLRPNLPYEQGNTQLELDDYFIDMDKEALIKEWNEVKSKNKE